MELTDKMLKHIWDFIDRMEPGQIVTIKTKDIAPNRPDLWVLCAEKWIDIYKLGEFNGKKTRFKKLEPIL